MQRRPIQPLAAAWRQLGIDVAATRGCPPVRVRGGTPREAKVLLDASVSSQFLSSLLLVGAVLPFRLVVEVDGALASRDYAQLTMRALHRFGIETTAVAGRSFAVLTGYGAVPRRVAVGGDWSAMGVWTCLNHVTGSRVRGGNLLPESGQADERLADVFAAFAGAGDRTIDVAAMPDQFPNLAVVAALGAGTTRFAGGANLRVKECDRIAVMARELRRAGGDVDELPDGLVVRGGRPLRPATIDPERDHRIAMAFALAGLVAPGVAIREPDCVAKSYPGFWQDVARVHAQHRPIALVGMRGAGKSTLGRALAARLGSAFVDTDEHFAAQHGPIAAFVAEHGWPAFRREEQRIVAAALAPGRVVATGGGAIESERTRATLKAHAVVVWLDAAPALLRARLAAGPDRPSLTGRPVLDELDDVLSRRRPIYEQLADHRIDAALPCTEQVARLLPEGPARVSGS